jgi:hypothetical protein
MGRASPRYPNAGLARLCTVMWRSSARSPCGPGEQKEFFCGSRYDVNGELLSQT